jgi:hypothetical protein
MMHVLFTDQGLLQKPSLLRHALPRSAAHGPLQVEVHELQSEEGEHNHEPGRVVFNVDQQQPKVQPAEHPEKRCINALLLFG